MFELAPRAYVRSFESKPAAQGIAVADWSELGALVVQITELLTTMHGADLSNVEAELNAEAGDGLPPPRHSPRPGRSEP